MSNSCEEEESENGVQHFCVGSVELGNRCEHESDWDVLSEVTVSSSTVCKYVSSLSKFFCLFFQARVFSRDIEIKATYRLAASCGLASSVEFAR